MRKYLVFFLPFIISLNCFSQIDSSLIFSKYNSSVSLTAFGTGVLGSVGYDKIIHEFGSSFISGRITFSMYEGQRIGYTFSDYIGKGNHHLVLGIGYNILRYVYSADFGLIKGKTGILSYPNVDFGYSYWNPLHRLSYTILVNPYTVWNKSFIRDVWAGFSLAYHFRNNIHLFNPKNTGSNLTNYFVAGNESNIGAGILSFVNVAKSPAISLNTNFYLKYYFSTLYLKVFAGAAYLTTHEIGSTSKYVIYDKNPYFLDLGIGAGTTIYSRSGLRIETGINIGNFFPENKMQLKPKSSQFNLNENTSYYLGKLDYRNNWIYRPFLFSPEVSIYRILSNRIDLGFSLKYTFNYYQFAGRYSFDWYYYKLKSNQFNLGITVQYRLSPNK